jgi:hypothetical protein
LLTTAAMNAGALRAAPAGGSSMGHADGDRAGT